MITKSIQQYAIVAGDSAQELTELLNSKLIELQDKNPTVTFEGLIARIRYEERTEVPEDLTEEYRQVGINLTCQDCPFFCPAMKADGSIDRRAKWGGCQFAKYERTNRDSSACEKLFQMINNGEVQLCLRDTE